MNAPRTWRGVMIQGTASSVGKSVIVAGICRALRREGYDVAPFKPQNMSNNAAVCACGGEIGRAQALQAQAAGLAPTVDMNPVLLKPEGDEGSQIIVQGRPWGKVNGQNFLAVRRELREFVRESWERLAAKHQILIAEGAGSPAEINLREGDIANMGFAEMADLPVILVGDVDRGGVFASLVGTLSLVSDAERERIKGFLINKFRGTRALLEPGLAELARRTGTPVLGVVPYLSLHLPEEDGWFMPPTLILPHEGGGEGKEVLPHEEGRKGEGNPPRQGGRRTWVGVVALPRISNTSDLDPLRAEEGVDLRFLFRPRDLAGCDAVVIPGTKNTVADLVHLHETGMAEAIIAFARSGGSVVGICGGYQMMGVSVQDPHGIESNLKGAPGLGLLPVETVITHRKVTGEARGATFQGEDVFGYEIHAGRTSRVDGVGWFSRLTRRTTGAVVEDGCAAHGGRIWGTYLHGVFDSPGFRRRWLSSVGGTFTAHASDHDPDPIEESLERLADALVESTDWAALKAIMGLR